MRTEHHGRGIFPPRFFAPLTHADNVADGVDGDGQAEIAHPLHEQIAAGPVLFERLDWRPYGIRPVLPIAATAPPGEGVRLDPVRAERARRLREQLSAADDDRDLGEALDRWELSLFQTDPFASEQLRGSLTSLLGGGEGLFAASLRAAAVLGETPRERAAILDRLRLLAAGDAAASLESG